MNVACEFCGKDVDPSEVGSWRRVVGWVQNRKGGGTHAVSMPSEPMGWAHKACMEIEKFKVSRGWQDTSLF